MSIKSAFIHFAITLMPNFLVAKLMEKTMPIPDLSVAQRFVDNEDLPPDNDIPDSWRDIHAMLQQSSKIMEDIHNDKLTFSSYLKPTGTNSGDNKSTISSYLDEKEEKLNNKKIDHPVKTNTNIAFKEKEHKKQKSSALLFCLSFFSFCTKSDAALPDVHDSTPTKMQMV